MTGKEISPADHQDKDIRKVLKGLVADGWTLRKEGHWGRLYCPCACLTIDVPGTPKNSGRKVRQIAREARRCPLPEDDPRRRPASPED